MLPTSQWWDGTTLKDIYTDEFLRVGRRLVDTCSNSKQNKSKILFTPTHFQKAFESIFQTLLRTDTRVELEFSKKLFKTHIEKQTNNFENTSEQVSKSPWITMDRKGANTFPFYNLPPEPRAISIRNFSVLLSFPFGENKRRWRLLLPRHFANQR